MKQIIHLFLGRREPDFKILSWIWFNLELAFLLSNLQASGKYPNCHSANAFKRILFFWKFMSFEILDEADSFVPAILHKVNTWS